MKSPATTSGKSFSTLRLTLSLMTFQSKRKLLIATGLGVLASLLDLVGVALFGILGAISVNGIQSRQPGTRTSQVLNFLNLENLPLKSTVILIAISASLVLVIRTAVSVVLTRKTLYFLSHQAARISGKLVQNYLNQGLKESKERTTQATIYSITVGVGTLMMNVLGSAVSMLSDVAVALVLLGGVLAVSLVTGLFTFIMFAGIGVFLYFFLQGKVSKLSRAESEISVRSNGLLLRVIQTYKEIFVLNKQDFFSAEIEKERHELAGISAERIFLPNISKYTMESAILLGTVLLTGLQFMLLDAPHAVATLSIFLVAGSRIGPSILRIQQGAVVIRSAIAGSSLTVESINQLQVNEILKSNFESDLSKEKSIFIPEIEIQDLCFSYSASQGNFLKNVNIQIAAGQSVAIVGPSAAGKTTLVDLMLGLLLPTSGSVSISKLPPREAIKCWPGSIGYVPQATSIFGGNAIQNVAFGIDESFIDIDRVIKVLKMANLYDEILALPQGMHSDLGESGNKLSGGQRQRLGIARALYSEPRLVILDEATSSLDGISESEVAAQIEGLKRKATVVIVAHRLSSIRNVDQVIYLADGEIKAKGTFSEVRNEVSAFDEQAQAMGL